MGILRCMRIRKMIKNKKNEIRMNEKLFTTYWIMGGPLHKQRIRLSINRDQLERLEKLKI